MLDFSGDGVAGGAGLAGDHVGEELKKSFELAHLPNSRLFFFLWEFLGLVGGGEIVFAGVVFEDGFF